MVISSQTWQGCLEMVQRLTRLLEQKLFGIAKIIYTLTNRYKYSTIFLIFRKLVLCYKWRASMITLEKYTELKEQKLKRAEIAAYLQIPDWKLKKLIAANGWGAKRPEIKNINAFADFSEESAYWGGFIAADGCITNNTLKICLGYDDLSHLEKFQKFMQNTHKITINTEKYYRCEMSFKQEKVIQDLKDKYNITERKSLTYKLPELDDKYFWHFLRGYFDGDGCICESFSNKNSITATLYTTITGSNEFINSLYNKVNLAGTIQQKQNVSVIRFNTNSSYKLLDCMYADCSIYLDRKFNLYKQVTNVRKTR